MGRKSGKNTKRSKSSRSQPGAVTDTWLQNDELCYLPLDSSWALSGPPWKSLGLLLDSLERLLGPTLLTLALLGRSWALLGVHLAPS